MSIFPGRALAGALLTLILAAPLTATAETTVVRDAQGQACKLVSVPRAVHKGPQAVNAYSCGGVIRALRDPTLTRSTDERSQNGDQACRTATASETQGDARAKTRSDCAQ